MLGPRTKGVIEKDDAFMGKAILASARSKDPSTQVGVCLVSYDDRIIGTGYNGFPRGIECDQLPWDRKANDPYYEKYLYIAHAEENSIANCDKTRLKNGKMYTTLYPCNKCAIAIIQHQIAEVIYISDKYHDKPEYRASRRMLELAGVKTRQFKSGVKKIIIDFQTGKLDMK